jgi:hypothetical protein
MERVASGMLVSAEIRLGTRTVMEYQLSPVRFSGRPYAYQRSKDQHSREGSRTLICH